MATETGEAPRSTFRDQSADFKGHLLVLGSGCVTLSANHRMNTPAERLQARAFSRVELCATIAALFLLAAVALPVLAQPFSRSQRLQCLNNLRQIGQAYQAWGNDHGDEFPFYVVPSQGGLRGAPEASRAYYQLAVLSNQLSSPKILACPSDSATLAANFGAGPEGLLHGIYQDNAVSYFVSHGRIANGPELLSGDRNIFAGGAVGCAYFTSTRVISPIQLGWRGDVHGSVGNVLMTSGEVLETGTASLRAAAGATEPTLQLHLVVPR